MDNNETKQYDWVNHPNHYNIYEEVVEIINKIAGPFVAAMWCKWNGFKYRMRMGTKPNNPIQQELDKENVYLNLYHKYKKQYVNEYVDFDNLTNDEKVYIGILILNNKEKIEKYLKTDFNKDVTINC